MRTVGREIKRILGSRWTVFFFLIMPPLLTVYFGLLFQQGVIEHARLVVVDQDQSNLSRSLVDQFADNKGFDLVGAVEDLDTAVEMVDREQVDAVVAVPPGFSRDLKKGKSPSVLFVADASNMAISSNAVKRAGEIILTFQAGIEIKTLESKGLPPDEAQNTALPLQYVYQQVGNPSGSFYDFLLWGLIGAVAHFPILVFSAASWGGEAKEPDFPGIAAKIAAYSFLGMGEVLFCLLLAILLFPLVFYGSYGALLLLVACFVVALTTLGTFLSLALPSPIVASQCAVIVALPALLLSGHTWPMSGFPWFVKMLGRIEPLTYFADPLRELALTGRTGALYRQGIEVLLLMSAICIMGIFFACTIRKKVHTWKSQAFSG
ncbi:ABC transporter permease [Candidatus Formimonas warabiya]|uniref:ABC-2 type transporter transmembrane domain-containing protein n=1 Tax=Formimonas warabiya TaxID=1761012 RepID=A0A3G1KU35_FORW1|nr:ABC transporter permease [Candidatus Formimonas warabiya]ATW25961.1 hypothetical protein DCMF_15305 [Candidatus Formimonas warabiya]